MYAFHKLKPHLKGSGLTNNAKQVPKVFGYSAAYGRCIPALAFPALAFIPSLRCGDTGSIGAMRECIVFQEGYKTKKPLHFCKGFKKKGDDILSHKLQYHLRRRA